MCITRSSALSDVWANPREIKFPVPDTLIMLDLGAKSCIPCKMMAPIPVELEKADAGRAAVIFIDVRENTDTANEFQISAIPTRIFYDGQGKEVWRHAGFLDKKQSRKNLTLFCGIKLFYG
ncbi:MAG: hypothetical protein BM485_15170 [Desulfobulbaceae bacterium DB1]|nr:MAG: hypothetical protein BM485_15170 [Desulfobulbaceae bacterium DB1]